MFPTMDASDVPCQAELHEIARTLQARLCIYIETPAALHNRLLLPFRTQSHLNLSMKIPCTDQANTTSGFWNVFELPA